MGYTGALSYSTSASRSTKNDIWLDGVTCGDESYSCLDICFCYPQQRTTIECDSNNIVALTCTFDTTVAFMNSPGDRSWCEESEKWICPTSETKPAKQTKVIIILGTVMAQ